MPAIRTWMVFCFAVVAGALLGTAGFWAAIVEPICGKKMSIVSGRMILCMFTSPLLHAGRRESIRAAELQRGVLDRCKFGTTTQMPARIGRSVLHPARRFEWLAIRESPPREPRPRLSLRFPPDPRTLALLEGLPAPRQLRAADWG